MEGISATYRSLFPAPGAANLHRSLRCSVSSGAKRLWRRLRVCGLYYAKDTYVLVALRTVRDPLWVE